MSNRTKIIIVLLSIGLAVGIWYVAKPYFRTSPAPQPSAGTENEDVTIDTDELGDFETPEFIDEDYDGTPYGFDFETDTFYQIGSDGTRKTIATPFAIEEYHHELLSYGTLFWKRGPDAEATIEGFDEPYAYETGADPEFQWYDAKDGKFYQLPAVDFKNDGQTFERVYAVYASSSERKLVVEVGEYDTASEAFPPGLVDEQPVRTHGVVINLDTRAFESGDPLTAYREALGVPSTLFLGMAWDSQRQVAVSVPGGEGCGAYDWLDYVNIQTKQVTKVGGANSFNFTADECNPSNGGSPDGRWFALYGSTKDGQRTILLFDVPNGATPVKSKTYTTVDELDYAQFWDTSKAFPVVTFSDGTKVDFNS